MEKAGFRHIFNRKNKLNSEGKGLIQLEIRCGNTKKYFSTKRYITPKEWEGIIKKHPGVHDIAKVLQKDIDKLEKFELEQLRLDRPVNIGTFVEFWSDVNTESFLDYFETFINNHQGTYSTYKQYRSTLNHLKRFNNIKLFADLTSENIQKFSDYLSFKGLSQQTVYNIHKRVKTAVRRAFVAGKISKNPYDLIRFQTPKSKEIRYLTESELAKVEQWIPDSKKLERIKDVFLFACYTGMSYSDLLDFEVEDGYIVDKRQKTGEGYIIYITPKAQAILDKWGKLPLFTNQVTNRYLKEVCYKAGIKEVTFHMARHTFAVDALNKGVPLEVVSRILGHSKISTTQVYAKILKGTIKSYMERL